MRAPAPRCAAVVGFAHDTPPDLSPLIHTLPPAAPLGGAPRRAFVGSRAERRTRSPARFPRLPRTGRGLDAGRDAIARRPRGTALRADGALAPAVAARGRATGDGRHLPGRGDRVLPLDVARGAPALRASHRNRLRHGAGRAG